ncbi:L-serine ammonia-lyase [Bacteroidota bacterium]
MTSISIFDMLKIGVGPSSSHTLGPWRAAEEWIKELKEEALFELCTSIKVDLYGSLSLTGKGHATDIATILGLSGKDPITFDTDTIDDTIELIKTFKRINFGNSFLVDFNPEQDISFHKEFLPFHPNGLTFTAYLNNGEKHRSTFYSIGGGFILKEEANHGLNIPIALLPYPVQTAKELLKHCSEKNLSISEIVLSNEKYWRTEEQIDTDIKSIWETMLNCMYTGSHKKGMLPGGLQVKRRAVEIHNKLIGSNSYTDANSWMQAIKKTEVKFRQILKWVSCFALSVNEVNASLGRVVTAPTNGSAGVIPSVLMYYLVIENHDANFEHIKRFLLVAGEIGCVFKKNATISAAMGGCQAEIGVSSAMAAAGLTELLGGTPEQVTIAAEIAMEHHLGLTCDPIGGLVQVPCIERNSMGAIKAISAAELALDTDPGSVKVSLDEVIKTMWETAKDMNHKYKETSEGGLAIAVNLPNC